MPVTLGDPGVTWGGLGGPVVWEVQKRDFDASRPHFGSEWFDLSQMSAFEGDATSLVAPLE